jgi:hypothetical protein
MKSSNGLILLMLFGALLLGLRLMKAGRNIGAVNPQQPGGCLIL